MRIVLHGQQAFGQAVLEKLLERGENVVAVCCARLKKENRRPASGTRSRERVTSSPAGFVENA